VGEGANAAVGVTGGAGVALGAAVSVGVARKIKPLHGHALTVMRRSEKAVDHFLISPWRVVCEKGVQLGGRGRQPGKIEANAAQ